MRKRNQPGIVANRRHPFLTSLIEQREMWLLCVPIIAWVLLFCYYPMYGLLMAFVNYTPGKQIWECSFVGLKYFSQFINGNDFWRILRNTLAMSGLNITVCFIAPILFAFMLNELGNPKVKKLVQTASYLPHFISTVVVCGMVVNFLANSGPINDVIVALGGQRIQFLMEAKYFRTIYIVSGIWQNIGWNSIIYFAAISAVDPSLYEAALMDGAGRFKQAIHVTLPAILPTVAIMLIMAIGSLLSVGYEKIILLYNGSTYETADVISTYVYRKGIQGADYSYSTAVGLFQSVIGLVFIWGANKFSAVLTETSLW